MEYKKLIESNIMDVVPLYIDYYNTYEDAEWTVKTTYKRIHQVVTREDSYGLVLYDDNKTVGFAMGYLEQFDDGLVYNLVEIVIAYEYQGKGIGTEFLIKLEKDVKELGGFLIQLDSVSDEKHDHFYGKFGYQDCNNLKIKSKMLE